MTTFPSASPDSGRPLVAPGSPVSRRTLVRGAAWTVPVAVATAPAARAGISQCSVGSSITVGPLETLTFRAICTADQTQSLAVNAPAIYTDYGTARLPSYLEICNCQNAAAWYRWQEQDTVSNFQIEVDGVHIDQNGPLQGWRPAFFLAGFGQTGGCQRFGLAYRTSVPRGTTPIPITLNFQLETGPTSTGPWTPLATPSVAGTVARKPNNGTRENVSFNSCTNQDPVPARSALRSAAPSDDGAIGEGAVGD